MAKIKTSEACDLVLDWAVAKSEGHSVYLRHDFLKARHKHLQSKADLSWHLEMQTNDLILGDITTGGTQVCPCYLTDWAHAGAIIDREMREHGFDLWSDPQEKGVFIATYTRGVPDTYIYGTTPLLAAMRCFVDARMGSLIDVPGELIAKSNNKNLLKP